MPFPNLFSEFARKLSNGIALPLFLGVFKNIDDGSIIGASFSLLPPSYFGVNIFLFFETTLFSFL